MFIRRIIICFIVFPFISACSIFGECGEEVSETYESPFSEKNIYKIERNCGATTPFVYHYYYADAEKELKNLNEKEDLFLVHVGSDLSIQWLSDTSISISPVNDLNADRSVEVIFKKSAIKGVTISYKDF